MDTPDVAVSDSGCPGASVTPSRPTELSKDTLLDAALALADAQGIEAITMRRIAEVLGVSSMAAYRHIRTKDEIFQGIGAWAWKKFETELDLSLSWDEQLRQVFQQMHRTHLEHPGLVQILLAYPASGLPVYRTIERLVGLMRAAGFTLDESIRAIASLESYTFGFTVHQRARSGRDPAEDHSQLHELPAAEFPNLSSAAARFAVWSSEGRFTAGLDWIITNLHRDLDNQVDR